MAGPRDAGGAMVARRPPPWQRALLVCRLTLEAVSISGPSGWVELSQRGAAGPGRPRGRDRRAPWKFAAGQSRLAWSGGLVLTAPIGRRLVTARHVYLHPLDVTEAAFMAWSG